MRGIEQQFLALLKGFTEVCTLQLSYITLQGG